MLHVRIPSMLAGFGAVALFGHLTWDTVAHAGAVSAIVLVEMAHLLGHALHEAPQAVKVDRKKPDQKKRKE